MEEEMVSIVEAARRLGMTRQGVMIAMTEGRLPFKRVAGRRVLPVSAVEAFKPRDWARGRTRKVDDEESEEL